MGDNIEFLDDEEVDRYMKDKKLYKLDWRRKHDAIYPRISKLNRKMLAWPATSVPSENVFSIGESLVTPDIACLDPDIIDELLSLNTYLKLKDSCHINTTGNNAKLQI